LYDEAKKDGVDRHQQEERLEAHFSVLIALLKNSGRYVRSGSIVLQNDSEFSATQF